MDEFEIISRYFTGAIKGSGEHIVIGPGDDCAVVSIPPGFELCLSTDTLIEAVHFPDDLEPSFAGEITANRVMAANLSDLAAMGAKPYGFTLAVTLPGFDEVWLSSFSRRLSEIADQYQLPLIGGNISKGGLSLTINIMGLIKKGGALLRSGANIGDQIYVSGNLGDAAGGLRAHQIDQDDAGSGLYQRYFNPSPRIELGQALIGLASACIDISDGLVSDLGHICRRSGLGARVETRKLPLSQALIDLVGRDAAIQMALAGGDDYELCFTVPPANVKTLEQLALVQGISLSRIGECLVLDTEALDTEALDDGGLELLDEHGNRVTVPSGYRHF